MSTGVSAMSMLLQQAFQQAMPGRQRNCSGAWPSSVAGTTGLGRKGDGSAKASLMAGSAVARDLNHGMER